MPVEQGTKLVQSFNIVPGVPFSVDPSLTDMRTFPHGGRIIRGERNAAFASEDDITFKFTIPVGSIKYFDSAEADHYVEFPLGNPGPTLDELRRKHLNNPDLLPVTFSIHVDDVPPEYRRSFSVIAEITGNRYEGRVLRPSVRPLKPAAVDIYTWFHEGTVPEEKKPYEMGFMLLFTPEQMSDFASLVGFTFTE